MMKKSMKWFKRFAFPVSLFWGSLTSGQNREREAMEEAKRRRKEIDREKKLREKMGLPGYQGIGKGGGSTGSGSGGPGFTAQQPQIIEQRKPEPSYSPSAAAPARKGLQLKKTAAKKDEYLEAMRQETGLDVSEQQHAAPVQDSATATAATLKDEYAWARLFLFSSFSHSSRQCSFGGDRKARCDIGSRWKPAVPGSPRGVHRYCWQAKR